MVDDTSQQSVQNTSQTSDVPVIPGDIQTTSDPPQISPTPADIGQIPPNWPSESEATQSAKVNISVTNSPISTSHAEVETEEGNLANDQTTTPSAEPAEIDKVEEPKQTWPISTNLANDNSNASPSAQIEQSETPVLEEKPIESKQHEIIPEPQSVLSEPKLEETKPENLANQPQEPIQASETQVEKQPEPVPQQVDTNIQPPDIQASQVQSGPSSNIPSEQVDKHKEELAEIKPEPLESTKEAPLVNTNLSESNQKSFGDLLMEEKPKKTEEPSKSFSFGDLLKEAQNTDKSNIPDDLFEIKDTPQEIVPPPQVQPPAQQSAPPPSQNPPSPQQSIPPVSPPTQTPQPQVIEKIVEVIKEVKVVDQEEVDKQVNDRMKSTLDQKRILANQARAQRKSNKLNNIMELARNTSNISNEDIQRLLHVSQSTATNYLSELSRSGMLKKEGIRGGTKYSV